MNYITGMRSIPFKYNSMADQCQTYPASSAKSSPCQNLGENHGAKPYKLHSNLLITQRNFVFCMDYAALRSVGVNAICMSRVVAPLAMSARTIKSSETEGSPASILAMRDWLDFMRCARSIWESFRLIKT